MIRRNTASQTIYLPAILLTADGAAVTTGATLQVAKDGTEAASAGTLTHVAGGVWKYTPTQAETDAALVGLILSATSAISVVLNLVTTAADTSAVALGANTVTPLDAAGVRTAVGLATANLDTQLGDVPTVAEFNARTLPSADYFVVGDYTAPANADIAAILVDTGTTLPATLASMSGATFDTATDSLEALRNRGDAAWVTATGFAVAGDAMTLATGAINAASIAAAAADKLADHYKRRTQANTEASSDGDALNVGSVYGLIQQAQESNTVALANSLTIYRTDGTTVLAQRPITTDATAEPVTGIS